VATRRGVGAALAVLGVGYAILFLIGRPFLLPLATPWPLWVWFLVCVLVTAAVAGVAADRGVARGLVSGAGFLLAWLVAFPLVDLAFGYFLPERPIVFGLALGVQLVLVLPPRGALAWLWRLLVPLGVDLFISVAVSPDERLGAVGIFWIAGMLLAIWGLEATLGARHRPRRSLVTGEPPTGRIG
jgi:hypothetical protein